MPSPARRATTPIYDIVTIYDIVSITTGKPQIGRVIHLTFFTQERAPDGCEFFDAARVFLHGVWAET